LSSRNPDTIFLEYNDPAGSIIKDKVRLRLRVGQLLFQLPSFFSFLPHTVLSAFLAEQPLCPNVVHVARLQLVAATMGTKEADKAKAIVFLARFN
jgi:hypothetical protein